MPTLTIGMAHFDDFCGLWATIQGLRLYHANALEQCELLVIDNNPKSKHGACAERLQNNWLKKSPYKTRWIAEPNAVGTAQPRNKVFEHAEGQFVLCMDCHVFIAPGAIDKLLQYYSEHTDTNDLLSGPMVYDDLKSLSTHFQDVWRNEMWGIWGTDSRGKDPDGEPFEIPAMGLGLFTCRKAAWPGFNKRFRGFGGEEFYIHEKVRKRGAKCLCLPFLRWNHRFGRPDGVKYPLTRREKVRNYIIGHQELGLPLDRVYQHFVTEKRTSEANWQAILAELNGRKPKPCKGCGGQKKPPVEPKTLQGRYNLVSQQPSDINQHCPKLRELASQCAHVTHFGMRHNVSTVALLAGQPKRLVMYDKRQLAIARVLSKEAGKTQFEFRLGDSLSVDIEDTDMLFIDTRHTAEHLQDELARHAGKVGRWIVLHDTQIYGEKGEDGSPGLLVGLREFLRTNPKWSVIYHTQVNNGLTVISRDPRDKPKLPSSIKMASHFVKAVANHVADDLKKTSSDNLTARLEVCTLCDQRTDNRCAVCGCFIDKKAMWESEDCPLAKWPAIRQQATVA